MATTFHFFFSDGGFWTFFGSEVCGEGLECLRNVSGCCNAGRRCESIRDVFLLREATFSPKCEDAVWQDSSLLHDSSIEKLMNNL